MARFAGAILCAACLSGLVVAAPAAAGTPPARTSVIGGRLASITDWGFAVAVTTPHTLCTGSVISPTKVLTAEHCVGDPATMTVRTNSTTASFGGDAIGVSSVAVAPGYAHGFQSDLAVLTLSAPTTATPIQPANAAEDAVYGRPGAALAVAGFGARNPLLFGKPRVGRLTAAAVSAKDCRLPPWAICDSGGHTGLVAFRRIRRRLLHRPVIRTICSGDSGGPLVASTPAGPRLVGIAEASSSPPKRLAFGFVKCGLKGFPALHTRVASYLDFIQVNLAA